MGTIKNCENSKMKITQAVIFAVAAADEKKVPPRHPLQRLDRLVEFSTELLEDHFGFWKRQAKFITKFSKAADRMRDAFERNGEKCGYYDPNNLPHGGPERKRRDFDDDFDRYISSCNGQAQYQHQVKRFNKYYGLMIDALNS